MDIKLETNHNLSTIEVEYIGILEATKEVLWLKGLALEMGFAQGAI